LKRQFDLDDAYVADLKAEIVDVHQLAVDQDGTILVWTGPATVSPQLSATPLPSSTGQTRSPICIAVRRALGT
jgi:hypothetical protein